MATAPHMPGDSEGRPDSKWLADEYGVLVGWSHAPCSQGIQLKLQSTCDRARGPRDIASRSFLMTRNQALILAKYLLDTTDQTLPPPRPKGRIGRLLRRLIRG